MRSVEALKLIDEGNSIEMDGFLYKKVDGILSYLSLNDYTLNPDCSWVTVDCFYFEEWKKAKIYVEPKEKVQYYQVLYKDGSSIVLSKYLYESKEDWLEKTSMDQGGYFIQLVPAGYPI